MASQSNKHKLNTFHLFAGAGGGILADLLLGHNPIGACEIEPYPRDVLLARQRDGILPNFPIWDDVCTLDGTPWKGSVDVLCGGFPCQDISAAGKGAGITGERSKLWKEYARLIGEMQPRFVFAENSPLLRTRGLGVVLEDLASLGYNARWGIIGARSVGAPHKRDRMWVLAYSSSLSWSRRGSQQRRCSKNQNTSGCGGDQLSGVSYDDQRNYPSQVPSRLENGSIEQAHRTTRSKVFGTGVWWTARPDVRRISDGVADRVDRLKAIGNGQVPQCAAVAFNILSEGLI